MKIFVTGGTGFIGSRVVQKLLARGHEVHALARSERSAARVEALGVRVVRGDITDVDSMREGMRGSDAVFHIAAWYELGIQDLAKLHRINVEGTRNVLTLAHTLGVPKIIYTSSIAVFDDTHGQLVDETYTCDGPFTTAYNQSKWEAHTQVTLPLIAAGAPIVIVMPGGVYGPGDRSLLGELLRAYLHGFMPVVLGPETLITYVHVDDVAEGHILALEKGRSGESYLLGECVASFREVFALWAELLGRRPPALSVPARFLHPFVPLLEKLERLVPLPTLINHESVRMLGVTYAATSAKARAELGWSPRPLREGMRETIESLRDESPPRLTTRQRGAIALSLGITALVLMLAWLRTRRHD